MKRLASMAVMKAAVALRRIDVVSMVWLRGRLRKISSLPRKRN
jgi:hypothetical protein